MAGAAELGRATQCVSIAALLTCHNRRKQTVECVESLRANTTPGVQLTVHLVDDGSSDGTAEAIRRAIPCADVVRGSGDLFWGGGMRLAFDRAKDARPDYMLWLNDDVTLEPDAIERLLATYAEVSAQEGLRTIVTGSTRDPLTGATTYGGVRRASRVRRMAFTTVIPREGPLACDTMNGNIVLVPRCVYTIVGNIDARFTHSMGDFDYGLRARQLGCHVYVAPGHLGTCTTNVAAGTYRDPDANRRERLKRVASPKGLPWKEWAALCRRHGGPHWPLLAVSPYVRLLSGRLR